MKKNIKALAIGLGLGISGFGVAAVTLPHNFLPGTPIKSSEVNAQFTELARAVTALEAKLGSTQNALAALESGKQQRVSGTCAVGSSIRSIDAQGNVECELDDLGVAGGGSLAVTGGLSMTDNVLSIAENGIETSKYGNSSVTASKILDEPSAAQAIGRDGVQLPLNQMVVLEQITIEAPANGFVLVMGSLQADSFVSQNPTSVVFGVSSSPTQLENDQDKRLAFAKDSSNTTGISTPVSMQKVFTVSAGINTFYLLGRRAGSGVVNTKRETLSAVFIPSSSGTVEELDEGTPTG